MCTRRNVGVGYSNLRMDSGSAGERAIFARLEATDADGYVRKVKVAVADQSQQSGASHYERPIQGLILLMLRREQKDRGFPAEEP